MRGLYPGSFTTAHALRDHTFWNHADKPSDTGERYDLVIVGGGISGLSAAYFYRKAAGDNARILILDVLDDFGGHAKRNEFDINGRKLLGYGGTYAIESPSPYSPIAKSVIDDLGIDVTATARVMDRKLYPSLGLGPGVFFDKETFGADLLLPDPKPEKDADFGDPGTSETHWKDFHEQAPMPAAAKQDIQRIYEGTKDYMPGLSPAEKKARLARMTLRQVSYRHRGRRPCGSQVFPNPAARLLRRGHRRGLGARRVGIRPPGFPGTGPGHRARSRHQSRFDSERRGREILVSFPRWQRVHRPFAGAEAAACRDSGKFG